jgi:hypothetical protein
MEEYIKTFDIQNFPGEDVTKASLRIKAVAQSLGTTRLPTDIVHRVLDGFARSSTPTFSDLCRHQQAMISSSMVKANLRQETLYKTLISMMADLETRYLELVSGNRWLGVGNNTTLPNSTFLTHPDSDSPDEADDDEYTNYLVLTAQMGRKFIPFEVWVKDKICRNCNEIGHIQRDCPKQQRLSTRAQPRQQLRYERSSKRPPSGHKSQLLPISTPKYSSKVQALISAACELANTTTQQAATLTVTDTPDLTSDGDTVNASSPPNHSSFLAALGCPKE